MIKDIFKIHDKFSVEIKQSYYSLSKKKKSDYRVVTYIFVPNALNINPQTYSKERFYKDSRVNIRYNTPEYSLIELISKEESPLNQFGKQLDATLNDLGNIQLGKLEVAGKIFAKVFNSAIKKANSDARKEYMATENENVISDFVEQISEVLKAYRHFLERIEKLNIETHQKTLLTLGDEFISNSVEHQTLILYSFFDKQSGIQEQNKSALLKLLRQEQAYKSKKYYDNKDLDSLDQEYIIHKRSQLKKYIDSVLFLKKDIRKEGTIAEQTIFALAAGFAMLFSTAIAFYYQQKYGTLTSTFFIALVISYMMKDRIKGVMSSLFINKANTLYYDYKIQILNTNNNKVGEIKENFSFVLFGKLEPKIKALRFKDRTLNVDDDLFGEQIIQYKKRIVLLPKRIGQNMLVEKLNSIVDVTRLNFSRFTQNMDNPKKPYYFVKDDKLVKSEVDRVYHINIIQKFHTERGIEFKRYRLVINKDGIKRIESVAL